MDGQLDMVDWDNTRIYCNLFHFLVHYNWIDLGIVGCWERETLKC